MRAVVTGGDRGIGRAVAIAYAREGADVAVADLDDHEDAVETRRRVEAGRKAVLGAGDLGDAAHCRAVVERAVGELGGIDILVDHAVRQGTFGSLDDIGDAERENTFAPNIQAMFRLSKAAVPRMKPGSAIVNTTSIDADTPNLTLLA